MIKRLLIVLLASGICASAQTTPPGAKAASPAATVGASTVTAGAKTAGKAVEEEADDSVVITTFRELNLPEAKNTRTFQLSKLNKIGVPETTKELQRLFSAYATQRIVDGSPGGSSKAPGYVPTVTYALVQDLGDNRFLAKAAWPAAGPGEALAAGVDTMAILLLEKPAKVGDTGKLTGMHAGTVSLLFTATYPPLAGKRLTLRREAFIECATLDDSPAALQKFIESVNAGAEVSVTTNELAPCKKCGGLGFTREPQKGQLDKHIDCVDCAKTGKASIAVETKFVP